MDCIFCKIAAGEIPATKVYEDENVLAFLDIHPQAPIHVLLVPKKHVENILACDGETITAVLNAAKAVALQQGVAQTGFRLITNCGKHGAQSVNHLHFHLVGGKQLSETMA